LKQKRTKKVQGCRNRIRVRSNVARERTRKFYEKHGYVVTKTQNVFDKMLDS
jgi:hypothetical protein